MSSSKLGVGAAGKRALAPPSPSPSNASNTSHGTPSSKRKRAEGKGLASASIRDTATPTPAAVAAAVQAFGDQSMTQLTYAIEFLKAKGTKKSLQEILDHLTLQHAPEESQRRFAKLMQHHPAIQYTPDSNPKAALEAKCPLWRTGVFAFRAKIPGVTDKTTLLSYLQRKTDASKLDVKDLKDGWPDCDEAIRQLEQEHKILVVRTKKDGHARYVWLDNERLFNKVDPEFQVMWHKVQLPSLDDMVKKLTSVGQKPASEDPRLKIKDMPKGKQKRRVNRASKKLTNTHMTSILQDYSHLKR